MWVVGRAREFIARRNFASSFSTGPPGARGALHCHWNAIATQPLGLVPFQARGILPVAEEQSRTRSGQSGGITDQPQCRGLWRSSSPSARSLLRSPSSPPPSFTQSPSPPRSPVRDGHTSPHRPRLVVSRSTCPPLSFSPPREQLCNRYCSNKHAHTHTPVTLSPPPSLFLTKTSVSDPIIPVRRDSFTPLFLFLSLPLA
jgi:hypothetical protein